MGFDERYRQGERTSHDEEVDAIAAELRLERAEAMALLRTAQRESANDECRRPVRQWCRMLAAEHAERPHPGKRTAVEAAHFDTSSGGTPEIGRRARTMGEAHRRDVLASSIPRAPLTVPRQHARSEPRETPLLSRMERLLGVGPVEVEAHVDSSEVTSSGGLPALVTPRAPSGPHRFDADSGGAGTPDGGPAAPPRGVRWQRDPWEATTAGLALRGSGLEVALHAGPGMVELPTVHRAAAALTPAPGSRPERFLELVAASHGEPMSAAEERRWAMRYGWSFRHVRLHRDGAAAAAAAAVSARAFTIGSHVFFAGGAGAPDTEDGSELMAHELAHVIQHDLGRLPASSGDADGGVAVSAPGDATEREADAIATRALQARPAAGREGPSQSGGSAADALDPALSGPVLRYADGDVAGGHLYLIADHGTEQVYVDIEISPPQEARFIADPELARRLATDLERAFNPGALPLFESPAFLASAAVSGRLRRDLDGWLAGGGLGGTTAFLAERQRVLQSLHFLYDLERHLVAEGFDPGTIDWGAEIPALLAAPTTPASNLIEASIQDRRHLFLRAVQLEASQRPAVIGAVAGGARLAHVLRDYIDDLPIESFGADAPSVFSEAFLATWTVEIARLRYIPDGFDLGRHAPTDSQADIDAAREQVLAEFVADWMPGLVTQHICDNWATSGQTEEGYLADLDMDSLRDTILDHLTDEFLRMAARDPRYRRVLRNAAAERARFAGVGLLVAAARGLDAANVGLADRFTTVPAIELEDAWERQVADDPFTYCRESAAVAAAMYDLLSAVDAGADLGDALGAIAIPPSPTFTLAVELIDVFTRLSALRHVRDQEHEAARDALRDELDLSYEDVAETIRTMWDRADAFIRDQYIPKLIEIALRRVTETRDELQRWLDNWGTETPRLTATYRISARVLDGIADELDNGETTSVELNGQVITADEAYVIRNAADALRALANRLDSEEGAEDKKAELQEAIDGYDDVYANIEDGTYPPYEWGAAVAAEARRELDIGEFPEFTTYRMIFTGDAVASENPFLARAIAGWEFRERLEAEFENILLFTAAGILTVAACLTGGAAGLILGAIDVVVGIGMGVHGVVEAQRVLELALLDPELELQGISVEQAREALFHAWVGLALSLIITVGAGALIGYLVYRGARGARSLAGLAHLQAAINADPITVERIMAIVEDAAEVDRLLGSVGGARTLDSLLLHCDDVAQIDHLLTFIGDGAQLARHVENAGSGAALVRILDRVPDVATFERLAGTYGSDLVSLERHLSGLGGEAAAAGRLEHLMENAGGLERMQELLGHCDDIAQLERLIGPVEEPARMIVLLERVGSGARAEALIAHCEDLAQLERLLDNTKLADAEQLERLLGSDKLADAAQLERLLEHAAFRDGTQLERLLAVDGIPHAAAVERLLASSALDAADVDRLATVFDSAYLGNLSDTMLPRYQRFLAEILDGTISGPQLQERLQVLSDVAAIRTELQTLVTGAEGDRLAIGQRNIAFGSFDIGLPGGTRISDSVVSVSGRGTSDTIRGTAGGTLGGRSVVPEVDRTHRTFTPTEGRAYHDSERKLFEDIIDRMEASLGHRLEPGTSYEGAGYSGRISVNTEMSPCDSCADVIANQFRRMFGSDVEVVVNYGVDYP